MHTNQKTQSPELVLSIYRTENGYITHIPNTNQEDVLWDICDSLTIIIDRLYNTFHNFYPNENYRTFIHSILSGGKTSIDRTKFLYERVTELELALNLKSLSYLNLWVHKYIDENKGTKEEIFDIIAETINKQSKKSTTTLDQAKQLLKNLKPFLKDAPNANKTY